jgi:hypothetical protein
MTGTRGLPGPGGRSVDLRAHPCGAPRGTAHALRAGAVLGAACAGGAGAWLLALAAPAAAASKHAGGGLTHVEIIEIAAACVVAIVLSSSAITLVRRSRTKRLVRQTSVAPLTPQALLGRLPPGRDLYGNELYQAEVLAARPSATHDGGGQPGQAQDFSQVMVRKHHLPWSRPADANMLSYELERLAVLRDAGTISEKEYAAARRRLLG